MTYLYEGHGQLNFVYALDGDPEEMITTVAFDTGSGGSGSAVDLDAAALEIESAWNATFGVAANLYTGWVYRGGRYEYRDQGGALGNGEVVRSTAGTAVGETPPVNTAMLVKKITGLGGRQNRGRMYIPPFSLSETNISKLGVIASGTVTGQQAYINTIMAAIDPDVTRLKLLHTNPANTPEIITQLVVQSRVATQRRRLRP